jgi:uncharacterized membrane protein
MLHDALQNCICNHIVYIYSSEGISRGFLLEITATDRTRVLGLSATVLAFSQPCHYLQQLTKKSRSMTGFSGPDTGVSRFGPSGAASQV